MGVRLNRGLGKVRHGWRWIPVATKAEPEWRERNADAEEQDTMVMAIADIQSI
jgi:hypothetical protein